MAPPKNARKLVELRKAASTTSKSDFARMVKNFDRPNIIVEGDSWFDYPRKALIAGPPSNIILHIQRKTRGKVNMLCLASNGDEMTAMMSGEQRHTLTKLLHKYQEMKKPIDVLFYSGGGNDVVGKWDLERFLKPHKPGFSADQCVNKPRLKNKIRQIELAYIELLEIRNQYSPDTVIITHTYDIPYANGKGAKFLGIKFTKPWLKPAMDKMKVPENLRHDVCRILIETMGSSLISLQTHSASKGKFKVAKTRGTLSSESQWKDEIHPKSAGFKLIAAKVYKELRAIVSDLPNW